MARLDRIFRLVVKWIKNRIQILKGKGLKIPTGQKMFQQKHNHLKKHVTMLMVLKNWHPMIFSMEKRFRIMLQYIKSTIKDFPTEKDVQKKMIKKIKKETF